MARQGLMLVLSSPSGAGKSTIARRLLAGDDRLWMSVSVTTRPPRAGEVEGRDYRFIDAAAYDELVRSGQLLEHARVFDHRYGTPRAPVEAALAVGRDVLFDVDWQGAQQLAANSRPGEVVKLFLLPPSTGELAARLRRRAQDSAEVVARRMARAAAEISHWQEYDYVLVNDDLERCLADVRAVLHAERLRRSRQLELGELVRGLMGEGQRE